jgi:hypothetical protein
VIAICSWQLAKNTADESSRGERGDVLCTRPVRFFICHPKVRVIEPRQTDGNGVELRPKLLDYANTIEG